MENNTKIYTGDKFAKKIFLFFFIFSIIAIIFVILQDDFSFNLSEIIGYTSLILGIPFFFLLYCYGAKRKIIVSSDGIENIQMPLLPQFRDKIEKKASWQEVKSLKKVALNFLFIKIVNYIVVLENEKKIVFGTSSIEKPEELALYIENITGKKWE